MKKTFLHILVGMIFGMSSFAWGADPLTVSTGTRGGFYDTMGGNLGDLLRPYDVELETLSSEGGYENLERVDNGEADLAFVQTDNFAFYNSRYPNNNLDPLGPLAQECVFLVAREDGPIDDEDDLENSSLTIASGAIGSGSEVSWRYLRELEDDYAEMAIENISGRDGLNKLRIDGGGVDAVLFVTRPNNFNHPLIGAVHKLDDLKFVSLDDGSLNNNVDGLGQVYEFKDVLAEPDHGFGTDYVEVPCTNAILVAHKDLKREHRDIISDILLLNTDRLTEVK